jgi:hypothetical protein
MQDAFQATQQAAKNDGRWPKGISGNPRGRLSRAEIAAKCEQMAESLASEFGGLTALTPAEALLIRSAARLAVMTVPRRSRADEVAVRVHNSISRSLAIVRKAHRRITRFGR